jgi:hypothetical protein
LGLLIIAGFSASSDVIPNNSHLVDKCIVITNLTEFPGVSLVGSSDYGSHLSSYQAFLISPNLAFNNINIQPTTNLTGLFKIELYTLNGEQLKTSEFQIIDPQQKIAFPIDHVAKGIYLIRVVKDENYVTRKVIIQ